MWRARTIAASAMGCLTFAVLMPSVVALFGSEPIQQTNAPLDPSLRVPLASIWVAIPDRILLPWDRVRGLKGQSDPLPVFVDARRDMTRRLSAAQPGESYALTGVGEDTVWPVSLVVTQQPAWKVVLAQWPLLLVGGIYLFLGLFALSGDRHPIASPVAAVALCIGIGLLGAMNLVLPNEPKWANGIELQARAAHFAWAMLPAALLHLAMRFPVVFPRFRQPSMVLVAYLFWLMLAFLSQARFHNASILNGLEKIVFGASVLAAGVLMIAGLARRRTLEPIEQARSRALAIGLGVAGIGPVGILVLGISPSVIVSHVLTLLLLSLPAALGWSVLRYNLLDTTVWSRDLLTAGGVSLVAFLLVTGAVSAGSAALGYPALGESPYMIGIALGTVGLYHLLRLAIRTFAGRSLGQRAGMDEIIAHVTAELVRAHSSTDVMRSLVRLLRTEMGAADASAFSIAEGSDRPLSPLEETGLALWHRAGSPATGVSVLPERLEDPGSERSEVVLSILSPAGPQRLVTISARSDGLPYSKEDLSAFERMVEVAVVALAAATAGELELEVENRTQSIAQSLRDRTALLDAAQQILEAAEPLEVRGFMELFLRSLGSDDFNWQESGPASDSNQLIGCLEFESSEKRYLVSNDFDSDRSRELKPIFETVCAFANLSLARLYTLKELRVEVRSQSEEIARITAESYQAEFVRTLAHELRKPAEEAESLALKITDTADAPIRQYAARIVGISAEFQRRLDALLCQSDLRIDFIRFDIVSVVNDVLTRSSTIARNRDYSRHHQLELLPVIGDPTRIGSVVENLIDNAVKATSDGGRIQVRTGLLFSENLEDLKASIYIEIEDDGVGIPGERLDSIFDPGVSFFSGGFGLGLALCRATVSAHDGAISVLSEPGRTRFRVTFPQVPVDLPDDVP